MSAEIVPINDGEGFKVGRWAIAASFWQNWSEWFRSGYNWRNFTFIALKFEVSGYHGKTVEVEAGVLGFNCRIDIYDWPDRAEAMSPYVRMAQDFCERHPEGEDGGANQ